MKKFFSGLIVILFLACTTSSRMADNQIANGHYRLYTYPEKLFLKKDFDKNRYKRIVIASSNNFNGNNQPQTYTIPNRFQEKRSISIGGIAAMKAYKDIFSKYYDNKILFVDSGSVLDHQSVNQINKTIYLYNYLNPDIMAVGENELSLLANKNLYFFNNHFKKFDNPFIASNLFDLSTAKNFNLKNVRQSQIKTIHNVKIGFLSVVDQQMAKNFNNKLNNLYIQNEAKTIISQASSLRRKGAQVIVLLTTLSIDCHSQLAQVEGINPSKVNFLPKENKHCDTYNNRLSKILNEIPKGIVDLIVSSGNRSKVANFIREFPIMQNEGEGHYYSWTELYFDTKFKRVDPAKTVIHQPVQLCHKFFAKTQDCFTKESYDDLEVSPAFFLGEKVNIRPIPRLTTN